LPGSSRIRLSGGTMDLRNWFKAHAYYTMLAVACIEPVGIATLTDNEDLQGCGMSTSDKSMVLACTSGR
jgi:hypothetical protein